MKKAYCVVFFVILLFAITGCTTMMDMSARTSLGPNEGTYTYTYETNKPQSEAFYASEEYLSLNITNSEKVIKLRQEQTGRIVAKPMMDLGLDRFVPYDLTISCKDNQLITTFRSGKLETGYWPSKNDMAKMEAEFKLLSFNLSNYINQY